MQDIGEYHHNEGTKVALDETGNLQRDGVDVSVLDSDTLPRSPLSLSSSRRDGPSNGPSTVSTARSAGAGSASRPASGLPLSTSALQWATVAAGPLVLATVRLRQRVG